METEMKLEHDISLRWLLLFALLTILSSIFANLYTTVDGIFVARWVDTNALSAINITLPMTYLTSALGIMFGTGGVASLTIIWYAQGLFGGLFRGYINGIASAILSFCRTIIFMVIPVLVLPRFFEMDGVWMSLAAGEILSITMSVYYFVKYRAVWQNPKAAA